MCIRDRLLAQSGQRPVLDLIGQRQRPEEVAHVVSQYEECQPDLIGHELVTRQPGPVQGVFAFLYPLLRRASAIVKADYPLGRIVQVGDDEAHSGKQLSLVPLYLGHHSSGYISALGLVDEVVIGDDGCLLYTSDAADE